MSERKKKENLDSRKKGAEVEGNEPLSWRRELIEWVKTFVIAAAIALFPNSYTITNSGVPSGSVERAVMTGGHIVGSRLAHHFGGEPKRGDIVIFKHKSEPGKDKTRLVRRVIGPPGETVDIQDNHIYINGSETPLEESCLPELMESDDCHFEIPEGYYLMLGDNRSRSMDVRRWSDPYVPEEGILVKVLIKYLPEIRKIQ